MIGRIIIGIIIAAVGVGLTLYGDTIYENVGAPEFAERYLGGRTFIKLLGILAAFIGFLVIFNLHAGFITWILGIFIPGVRQQSGQ